MKATKGVDKGRTIIETWKLIKSWGDEDGDYWERNTFFHVYEDEPHMLYPKDRQSESEIGINRDDFEHSLIAGGKERKISDYFKQINLGEPRWLTLEEDMPTGGQGIFVTRKMTDGPNGEKRTMVLAVVVGDFNNDPNGDDVFHVGSVMLLSRASGASTLSTNKPIDEVCVGLQDYAREAIRGS